MTTNDTKGLDEIWERIAEQDAELARCAAALPPGARFDVSVLEAFAELEAAEPPPTAPLAAPAMPSAYFCRA